MSGSTSKIYVTEETRSIFKVFLTHWASRLAAAERTSTQSLFNADEIVLASATHSWIKKMASIGDSYAAGLGSGKRVDFSCSRYSTAYPTIIHNALNASTDSDVTHQSLACSGADTTEILAKQVPALQDNLDLITISAGGNDIGLTPILSNCVYQFYMASENACRTSIAEAQAKITNDTQLSHTITKLIEATKPHLNATNDLIYITGYARFFGIQDSTCDNVA
jgi:lysophospholipase L1-like esterase